MIRVTVLWILSSALFLLAFAGEQLTGTAAPQWNNSKWINSEPLTLSQLRGKVVLIRFFMESSCPMCRGSAPYLNQFYNDFRDDGLVVIGMYTPKPAPKHTDISLVKDYVQHYGFQFPVAVDDEWATLKKFWLDRVPNADYTSVSFLLDRQGTIRMIHPGGLYSSEDGAAIRKKIEELLKEEVGLTEMKPQSAQSYASHREHRDHRVKMFSFLCVRRDLCG